MTAKSKVKNRAAKVRRAMAGGGGGGTGGKSADVPHGSVAIYVREWMWQEVGVKPIWGNHMQQAHHMIQSLSTTGLR